MAKKEKLANQEVVRANYQKISFTNYFHRPEWYFFNWTDYIEGT